MQNIIKLNNQLQELKGKGWIKCTSSKANKVGLMIEELLGINPNQECAPDIDGIEIKTRSSHSKPYMTLFSAAPDSMENAVKYVYNRYNYPSKNDKTKKVFNVSIDTQTLLKHPFRDFILYSASKDLKLHVYNKKGMIVDSSVSWSHNMLRNRLYYKFNYLCLITSINKKDGDDFYFRVNHIRFYRLRSFEAFLKLIESGKIRVSFKIGLFTGEYRYGEIHDRGTSFDMNIYSVDDLFERISI